MIRGMRKATMILAAALALCGCNSVNVKPHSLDRSEKVYALYGGYHMRFAVKQELEERGYKVIVGQAKDSLSDDEFFGAVKDDTRGARYVLRVREPDKTAAFAPAWCVFNGFWWWKFDLSIMDQKTGEELLAWTGRGCANGNLRRLNRIMDELEKR